MKNKVNFNLPLEVLELTADILKEDVKQIKEAAEEITGEVGKWSNRLEQNLSDFHQQ